MNWGDSCSICQNDALWWTSKQGYKVCMVCSPNPLAALVILARRGYPGLVEKVESWQQERPISQTTKV
jgi:hypothetical protein